MNAVQRVEKGLDQKGLIKTWNSLTEQTDYVRGLILIEAKKDCDENSSTGWEKYLEGFSLNGKHLSKEYVRQLMRATEEKATLDNFKKQTTIVVNSLIETEAELTLPEQASVQIKLKGKDAVTKAKSYREIKETLNKDKPSAVDITEFYRAQTEAKDAYTKHKARCSESTKSKANKSKEADEALLELELTHQTEDAVKSFEDWAKENNHDIVFNKPKSNVSMYGLKDPSIKDLYAHSSDWKRFYRKIARTVHPDAGGDEEDMQMLNMLNVLMNGLSETYNYHDWENKIIGLKKQWRAEDEQKKIK